MKKTSLFTSTLSTPNTNKASSFSKRDGIISSYGLILSDKLKEFDLNSSNSSEKQKRIIKIAIIGAGIGGCSSAYFLEEIFQNDQSIQLEIDIFEKENDFGGKRFEINFEGSFLINFTQTYIKNFTKNLGCKLTTRLIRHYLLNTEECNNEPIEFAAMNQVFSVKNFWLFMKTLGLRGFIMMLKYIYIYVKYRFNLYVLQDQGFSFDNIEKLLRKIDPQIFTLSQNSFKVLLGQENLSNLTMENFCNLAISNTLGQTCEVPGLIGIQSILNFCSSSTLLETKSVCEYMLSKCKTVKVHLDTHVKFIGYGRENAYEKNIVTFEKNKKEKRKNYDYSIITFPLTKDIKNQNFWLDILYRDFLDCEMKTFNASIVNGNLSMCFSNLIRHAEHSNQIYVQQVDSNRKIVSLTQQVKKAEHLETDEEATSSSHKYKFLSTEPLTNSLLKKYFEEGFEKINEFQLKPLPLYKKVRYTHTPFPQIVIDGTKRSRVYYLNSFEWLECSKESCFISARNISYLIAKKEMNKNLFEKCLNSTEKFFPSSTLNTLQTLIPVIMFSSVYLLLIAKKWAKLF